MKEPRKALLQHVEHVDGFFEIKMRQKTPRYLCRRAKDLPLVRIKKITLGKGDGEEFYLRLLLLSFPFFRWKDILIHDDEVYKSYQMAAISRGLVEANGEAVLAFDQFSIDGNNGQLLATSPQLRALFATMTLEGFATLTIFEDHTRRWRMMDDYQIKGMSFSLATNELLKDLAYK
jgi:hypothetical protein